MLPHHMEEGVQMGDEAILVLDGIVLGRTYFGGQEVLRSRAGRGHVPLTCSPITSFFTAVQLGFCSRDIQ